MSKTAIYIDTRDYLLAHGKEPRGRGMWAFFFDGRTHIEDVYWSRPNMTYREALAMAKVYARDKGHTVISIGS